MNKIICKLLLFTHLINFVVWFLRPFFPEVAKLQPNRNKRDLLNFAYFDVQSKDCEVWHPWVFCITDYNKSNY